MVKSKLTSKITSQDSQRGLRSSTEPSSFEHLNHQEGVLGLQGRGVLGQSHRTQKVSDLLSPSSRNWLQIAQLRAEKCALTEAKDAFAVALELAYQSRDSKSVMEAYAGLLRLAGEALDADGIAYWDKELDSYMRAHPNDVPFMAWYCKGAVARCQGHFGLAQRNLHRYLKFVSQVPRQDSSGQSDPLEGRKSELLARGWITLGAIFQQRGLLKRAQIVAESLLKEYE